MKRLLRRKHLYRVLRKRVKNYGKYFHALKSSGKPCSCWACRNEKYSRKIKHKTIES